MSTQQPPRFSTIQKVTLSAIWLNPNNSIGIRAIIAEISRENTGTLNCTIQDFNTRHALYQTSISRASAATINAGNNVFQIQLVEQPLAQIVLQIQPIAHANGNLTLDPLSECFTFTYIHTQHPPQQWQDFVNWMSSGDVSTRDFIDYIVFDINRL